MRLLLDTHVFLWYVSGDRQLSSAFLAPIRDPENEVFVSVVSTWECVVKYGIGKLALPAPPESYLPEQRKRHHFSSLPIDEEAFPRLAKLPALHRDPFDRMLVAQAQQHHLKVATVDAIVRKYPIESLPMT